MKMFGLTGRARFGMTTAMSIALTAGAAQADVTPADVWADWQGYLSSSGYEVSGEESQSGDALTVSDVTMSMAVPEEDMTVSVNLGEITFTDNGDGTVSVSIPASMPMQIQASYPDAEEVAIGLEYNTTGFEMTASGDPDDLLYNYSASEIAIIVGDVVAEGETVDIGTVEFRIADVEGTTTMTVGNLRTSEQKMTAGPVNYTIDVADPEGSDGQFTWKGQFAGMTVAANGAMPLEMDPGNFAASIENGFDADATITYSEGSSEFEIVEPSQTTQGTTSSDGGEITVAMGADGLTYDLSASNMQLNMTGGDIPLPIEVGFGTAAFNLTAPIVESEEEQDFALGLTLGDFTMSDMIWGIFDPAGQLPRDPATIDLDLTGTAKLFFDLFDPEQMEAAETGELGVPGELNTLDINTLTVSAAGAELTGEGAFTFDNSDLETFDGMPAPDGSVDLKLTGANGLLDTLIAMGIVPEEQAMGVRMMMGMFAVPGDGEDTLNSTIEVKSDGQVLANGQRLR
ncbi:hypothetical protein FIU86_03385 [Roseovarius sp. THAF9]|uniref:DUF2125 domain-containing protein n=1 Tax=Roseovarius sp. THAF9 TaxID=2587847 RepID=UPI0012A917E6|nr:DUF2125 domain-containing protein [Roseovarius sp. THAF9]QFT91870.1 hypothetical protein FIU86_03385 [Roseovarius sp. THAF9]